MRETTLDGAGPVETWPRRRLADERGRRRLVQRARYSHKNWTRFRGPHSSGNSYTYNGAGLRVGKTVAGVSAAYVWDIAEGLPLLIQDGSTYYVTGLGGMPLEQINGSTVFYYHQDQLGSSRGLTDAAGASVASYNYDPYGNITSQTGTISNPFLFAGQYRDAESGLYHLRARYYDPTTGQFISRDPKVSATWSPYGYVAGNPMNLSDPTGLDLGLDIGGAIYNAAMGAINYVSNQIGGQYMNFAAMVSIVCPPAGSFMFGMAAGFNFDLTSGGDTWFQLGEGVGLYLALATLMTGPEDPLADVTAVRLASRAPKAAELVTKGAKAAEGAGAESSTLRIFASEGRAAAAERAGALTPGASGKLFATNGQYQFGNIAQSNLAISARGANVAGYWDVPAQYASKFSYAGRVAPTQLWEGGGREFTWAGSIPYDQLGPFRLIPWAAGR